MSFENQIQQWVIVDNQLKSLNDKMKVLRDTRNALSGNITNYAEKNNLTNSTVNISDGKLKFVNTKVQAPLTFKFLEKIGREQGRNVYWSIRLALWWFSSGFKFEKDYKYE